MLFGKHSILDHLIIWKDIFPLFDEQNTLKWVYLSLLNSLFHKHNGCNTENGSVTEGYRLLIYFGTCREKAFQSLARKLFDLFVSNPSINQGVLDIVHFRVRSYKLRLLILCSMSSLKWAGSLGVMMYFPLLVVNRSPSSKFVIATKVRPRAGIE